MEYKEVTTFSIPIVIEWDDISTIKLNKQNQYFIKLEELTKLALQKCQGKFMVGFTDLMPGMDCGRVTSRKTANGREPRSIAASSKVGSSRSRLA